MNILFIEDELELLEVGVAQLEQHNTVYPASNLSDARAIMENPAMLVHLVVADHRLVDGPGIEFVIEMKALFPDCMYTIVSGCLTDSDISKLEENEISYHRKPLLYGKIVEEFRRAHLMKAPRFVAVAEAPCDVVEELEAPSEMPDEPEVPKRKKWFGVL